MASRKRFKRMVHYVCDLCDDTSKLGATKLNKVLWYSDTFAYRLTGQTISGESAYVKRQFGPVPKNILATLDELQRDGVLHVRESLYFGKPKKEFQVLEPADPSGFDETERAIMEQVVRVICDEHTATSISDMSHDQIWEAAEVGEEIPIFTVLAARAAPVTKEDERWANQVIKNKRKEAAAA